MSYSELYCAVRSGVALALRHRLRNTFTCGIKCLREGHIKHSAYEHNLISCMSALLHYLSTLL